ncbi:hypothetical protein V2J09_012725 [Rumex salicifolius]
MARDFMGIYSKEPLASVKLEITDEGPETQWPFMKNSYGPKTSVVEFQNSVNLTGATMTRQYLGIPMTRTSPVVGFTDPWNNKKSFSGPSQMTIFYSGSVSVYDDISPDKAEAIRILAGNGSSQTSNMIPKQSQIAFPFTKASLSSLSCSVSKDEQTVIEPEPQRVVASSVLMPVMTSSAVPQFRKASLACFLEKRKERVMCVAPYKCERKAQEDITKGNIDLTSAASFSTIPSTTIRGS